MAVPVKREASLCANTMVEQATGGLTGACELAEGEFRCVQQTRHRPALLNAHYMTYGHLDQGLGCVDACGCAWSGGRRGNSNPANK